MKDYGFMQTFAVSGGTSAEVVDGLMRHAADTKGRRWLVQDLAVHQMADRIAVSGSVSDAHVAAALAVFEDFTLEFLTRCTRRPGGAKSRIMFTPLYMEITYDAAIVAA